MMGPRSSLSIGLGFGRCSGISPKFARRFSEWIEKLAGNTLGDRRKKIESLILRMSKAAGLAGASKPSVNIGCTAVAQAFRRLTTVDLLRLSS
ncbi:hypothetical protein BHM03_00053016 [Ensete ventricosum]|nr:hypothetical protein BHM03_00053016 [Ensete ventricosum]